MKSRLLLVSFSIALLALSLAPKSAHADPAERSLKAFQVGGGIGLCGMVLIMLAHSPEMSTGIANDFNVSHRSLLAAFRTLGWTLALGGQNLALWGAVWSIYWSINEVEPEDQDTSENSEPIPAGSDSGEGNAQN